MKPKSKYPGIPAHISIPHPLPDTRRNEGSGNAALVCAACGNPIGADLFTPLEQDSVVWGNNFKARIFRVVVCRACWMGKKPLRDPATYTRAQLKALVLNCLSARTSKRASQLAVEAGLRNSEYLHEFLYELRDEGEIKCSRGAECDGEPVWKLESD